MLFFNNCHTIVILFSPQTQQFVRANFQKKRKEIVAIGPKMFKGILEDVGQSPIKIWGNGILFKRREI